VTPGNAKITPFGFLKIYFVHQLIINRTRILYQATISGKTLLVNHRDNIPEPFYIIFAI